MLNTASGIYGWLGLEGSSRRRDLLGMSTHLHFQLSRSIGSSATLQIRLRGEKAHPLNPPLSGLECFDLSLPVLTEERLVARTESRRFPCDAYATTDFSGTRIAAVVPGANATAIQVSSYKQRGTVRMIGGLEDIEQDIPQSVAAGVHSPTITHLSKVDNSVE